MAYFLPLFYYVLNSRNHNQIGKYWCSEVSVLRSGALPPQTPLFLVGTSSMKLCWSCTHLCIPTAPKYRRLTIMLTHFTGGHLLRKLLEIFFCTGWLAHGDSHGGVYSSRIRIHLRITSNYASIPPNQNGTIAKAD